MSAGRLYVCDQCENVTLRVEYSSWDGLECRTLRMSEDGVKRCGGNRRPLVRASAVEDREITFEIADWGNY